MPIKLIEDTHSIMEGLLEPVDFNEEIEENPLYDFYEGRSVAEEQIKVGAQEVASFENDINHSPLLSWHVDFTLFIAPTPTSEGGYALLNLSWDDNYGCWGWECETALTGASSMKEAKEYLLGIYKESYIPGAEGEFRKFLETLS